MRLNPTAPDKYDKLMLVWKQRHTKKAQKNMGKQNCQKQPFSLILRANLMRWHAVAMTVAVPIIISSFVRLTDFTLSPCQRTQWNACNPFIRASQFAPRPLQRYVLWATHRIAFGHCTEIKFMREPRLQYIRAFDKNRCTASLTLASNKIYASTDWRGLQCVWVCVREREGERKRDTQRGSQREMAAISSNGIGCDLLGNWKIWISCARFSMYDSRKIAQTINYHPVRVVSNIPPTHYSACIDKNQNDNRTLNKKKKYK